VRIRRWSGDRTEQLESVADSYSSSIWFSKNRRRFHDASFQSYDDLGSAVKPFRRSLAVQPAASRWYSQSRKRSGCLLCLVKEPARQVRQAVGPRWAVERRELYCLRRTLSRAFFASLPRPELEPLGASSWLLVKGRMKLISGGDLLSHTLGACSTIGAEGLNCRVRNGNGCDPLARATGKLEICERTWGSQVDNESGQ
jgi:hypothetical protein